MFLWARQADKRTATNELGLTRIILNPSNPRNHVQPSLVRSAGFFGRRRVCAYDSCKGRLTEKGLGDTATCTRQSPTSFGHGRRSARICSQPCKVGKPGNMYSTCMICLPPRGNAKLYAAWLFPGPKHGIWVTLWAERTARAGRPGFRCWCCLSPAKSTGTVASSNWSDGPPRTGARVQPHVVGGWWPLLRPGPRGWRGT